MTRYLKERGESAGGGAFGRGVEVFLVNCLRADGTSSPEEVARSVGSVRRRAPRAQIIALLDETDADAVRAARRAGATSFVGSREASNEEAVSWRVLESSPAVAVAGSSGGALTARRVRPGKTASATRRAAEPSRRDVDAARAAVDASVAALPSPAARLAGAAELAEVDAPALRHPGSGRFDAKRIASELGIPVARLARVVGISQQGLSAKPDSPRAQDGLLPIARVLAALDELLPAEQRRMWLNTPRDRFGGETPLALIQRGEAAALARAIEGALEGEPG